MKTDHSSVKRLRCKQTLSQILIVGQQLFTTGIARKHCIVQYDQNIGYNNGIDLYDQMLNFGFRPGHIKQTQNDSCCISL